MRVECLTIEDFCEELEAEAEQGRVVDKIVRVRMHREPEQDEEITFLMGLWATALIGDEDGRFVLEFGQVSGRDEPSADIMDGSLRAREWKREVEQIAAKHGLAVRRGKIEIW